VVLFADATRLHLFPPLRAAWARVGTPAIVPVTGRNGRCVLFGALNVCTGHCIVVRQSSETSPGACAFLTEIRRRYRRAPTIWLLLDQGPAHTAVPSRQSAADLRIQLVWLPKQWPELNGMDQLWRELKRLVAANRQASSVAELAQQAENWLRTLSPREALRKAGILSERFWLRHLLQKFWPNT
jgi:transposase InsO family protein